MSKAKSANPTGAPSTVKQPSRKGKKAWRKNVDLVDVEQGLETVREEITKGGVIAEKKDDELFAIDVKGDASISKKYLRETKRLKCDEILAQRSAIPAVSIRKRASEAVGDGILRPSKKRKDGISHKELTRLKELALGSEGASTALISKNAADVVDKDPWAEEPAPQKNPNLSYLEEYQPKPVKEPPTLKTPAVSLSATGRPIPAVKKPDPGISYNPEFDKWDKLLTKEGEAEVEREKERLRVKELEKLAIEQAKDITDDVDDMLVEQEEDEEESDAEEKPVVVKKKPERKTKAERNKIKRRKEEERKRQEELRKKKIKHEVELVKKYYKQMEEKEKERKAKKEAAAEAKAAEVDDSNIPLRKKKFGTAPLGLPPLDVQLPEELAESLRQIKPVTNLVGDRFRSLRERGLIETRKNVSHAKQRKVKATEKWSYKDFV